MVTVNPNAARNAANAAKQSGAFVSAIKTAAEFVMKGPKMLLNAAIGVTMFVVAPLKIVGRAAMRTKLGAFLGVGAGLVATGFGLKAWGEAREHHKEQEIVAATPEAVALKSQLEENQAKLVEISTRLGANNPQGNFRETVRSGGIPVGQQPEYNP